MVPGGSGEYDPRSVSAAVRHWRRTCQVQSRLGKGRNRPTTTYPNSKEEEKPSSKRESKFMNESESRTEAGVRSADCC